MTRILIEGNGNHQVSVPKGRRFSLACSGTFGGGTITAKYHTGMATTPATGTLTISGVVFHSSKVTIGSDVYEFTADAAQTVTAGSIPVDITAVTTAAQGTLTIAAQPTAGDTMSIGTKSYIFVAGGAGAGEISIGSDLATAKAAILGALNYTDGVNLPNDDLTYAASFSGNNLVITAKVGGTVGNALATTSVFTNVGNLFNGLTLGTTTLGVDCIAADAVAALVAADAGTLYTLTNGAGDTVVVTSEGAGESDNLIATTETMANGAFGAATLTGGTEPIDWFVPFATTAIALTAAGEKSGTNVGAHNEINLAVTGSTSPSVIAIVNVLED